MPCCPECDKSFNCRTVFFCDGCGIASHQKCLNKLSGETTLNKPQFLFCKKCLFSFNKLPKVLIDHYNNDLLELKHLNNRLKLDFFEFKKKLEFLETELIAKDAKLFENTENAEQQFENPDSCSPQIYVNCLEDINNTNVSVQIEFCQNEFNESAGRVVDLKKCSGGANTLSAKKVAALKQKKIASPKIASPKVLSPKLESASTVSTPKVASPKQNSAKSENTEETKTSKPSRAATSTPKAASSSDSGNEGKNAKSPSLKVKLSTKPKSEKKQTAQKQVAPVSEESSPMVGKKAPQRKSNKWSQKHLTSESPIKTNATSKKKTIKLNNITNQSNEKTAESQFMGNYLQNLSYGYNTLLHVFQYLKVQDLLRAGCVCTMWRDIASHPSLWRTVRMKNSQVHSFEGLANTLQKHGTVQLDLRKMLLTNCDDIWPEFSSSIGKVDTLRKIELCRCPASVVEKLTESNPKLEVVNAVTIRCETMDLEGLENWENLRELRLKSTTGLTLKSDIDSLKSLINLKILSLTSIRDLNTMKLEVIAELINLESLDLGECTDFPENFGKDILSKLTKLEKLRLEKGQGNCHTFEIFDAVKDMKHLEQLELVNFDIKTGFDKALGACKNIKKLLIIPTYISQSATTNHMVLGGVLRLQKSLSHFVWGVTLELLRVTELFVDQCEEPEKKEKKEKKVIGNGDSIPVLKPVPLISDDSSEIPPALDPPQVEILALPGLQKLLLQSLPSTRVKILKIPFHATWRQTITDAVN